MVILNKVDYLIKHNDRPFEGICWCKEAVYLDYYNNEVRKYWESLFNTQIDFFFKAKNIHVWNDMNEPSVFEAVDLTLPRTSTFNYRNSTYEHREAHNIYGHLMHKSTYRAMRDKYQKRPFVLTRSFYIGSQKYGAVWTGDMRSTFSDMKLSISMVIQMSISGYSFVGADVGGFAEEGDYYLYVRWYQLGVFYPFFRAHSQNETKRREPWLYDSKTLNLIRNAIIMRYRLLPYIYYTFYKHVNTGMPVIQPIWFKYPEVDYKFHTTQFLFGDSILVRPVVREKEHFQNNLNLYLPDNERWYDLYDYKEITNKNEINYEISENKIGAFIKGGSVIPMKMRLSRSSKKAKNDPITLIITADIDNNALGYLYLDDEESYDYIKSKYTLIQISLNKDELVIDNIHSNYNAINFIEKIILVGFKPMTNIQMNEKNLNFENKDNQTIIHKLNITLDKTSKIIFY